MNSVQNNKIFLLWESHNDNIDVKQLRETGAKKITSNSSLDKKKTQFKNMFLIQIKYLLTLWDIFYDLLLRKMSINFKICGVQKCT